jgi:A/G-specific adenine glycosylase
MVKSTVSASPRYLKKSALVLNSQEELRLKVIEWFRREARVLPWRKTKDPYRIWISEMMCQQTGVSVVVPYYERFLARFPDVFSLAAASEEEVIHLWEGLGYYSRARNILKAAKILVSEFKGCLPADRQALLRLPGIGEYSAGAILAIAFSRPEPALDGNLIRIFSRYFGERRPVDRPAVLKDLWSLAAQLVPQAASETRDFTEGLMDLGASVCRPKNPACPLCPLKRSCIARARLWQRELPIKEKKTKRIKLDESIFVVQKNGRIKILDKGADPKFPHFYRLPYATGSQKQREDFKMKYSVTHRDFNVRVYLEKPAKEIQGRWINISELEGLSFPAIDRKIIRSLHQYIN